MHKGFGRGVRKKKKEGKEEQGKRGGGGRGGRGEQTLISGDVMTLFGTHSIQQYILSSGQEKRLMSFTRRLLAIILLFLILGFFKSFQGNKLWNGTTKRGIGCETYSNSKDIQHNDTHWGAGTRYEAHRKRQRCDTRQTVDQHTNWFLMS